MVALVQRVKSAAVDIGGQRHSEISTGLLILLGVAHEDSQAKATALTRKV
ncbi:MAG: D-aminoacyl-tRNA deacylase, partial [Turneriella sp.]